MVPNLDIPVRSFSTGFPGSVNLFEWFAIRFRSRLSVDAPGSYGFRICSDDGSVVSIIELPLPSPVLFDGVRVPASYGNFYIANGIVLVPVFNDPNDRIALDILADLFPDREIVGIYCGDLIWGFGAIHCMTQQQPALST